MKKNGQTIKSTRTKPLLFRRGSNPDDWFNFTLTAVDDFEPFRKKCQLGMPPWAMDRHGKKEYNYDDPRYKEKAELHNKRFESWTIIMSLRNTEWLEWDTIDLDDPDTWLNWEQEMKEAGISAGEREHLKQEVSALNSLTDNSIEEAMNDFLALLSQVGEKLDSNKEEQASTQSIEPASDSEFFPQESESQEQPAGISSETTQEQTSSPSNESDSKKT